MMTVTYDTALAGFRQAYPAFATTAALDELRATEYARLDACGQTYLDYTGGGLYAASQLREHQAMLAGAVLGNPHSQNLPSREMTERIEATRARILARSNLPETMPPTKTSADGTEDGLADCCGNRLVRTLAESVGVCHVAGEANFEAKAQQQSPAGIGGRRFVVLAGERHIRCASGEYADAEHRSELVQRASHLEIWWCSTYHRHRCSGRTGPRTRNERNCKDNADQ